MKFFSLEEKNLLKKISEKTITKKDLENNKLFPIFNEFWNCENHLTEKYLYINNSSKFIN